MKSKFPFAKFLDDMPELIRDVWQSTKPGPDEADLRWWHWARIFRACIFFIFALVSGIFLGTVIALAVSILWLTNSKYRKRWTETYWPPEQEPLWRMLDDTHGPPLPKQQEDILLRVIFPTPLANQALKQSISRIGDTIETSWEIALKDVRIFTFEYGWNDSSCDLYITSSSDPSRNEAMIGRGTLYRYETNRPFQMTLSLMLPVQQIRDLMDRWTIFADPSPGWVPMVTRIKNWRYESRIQDNHAQRPWIEFDIIEVLNESRIVVADT